MWHVTTVLIFLRESLLLAFKHGVQGRADDCCVEKRTHTQEISLRILKIRSSRIAPPAESPPGSALATTNGPLRHGRLNRMMEEETKGCRSGAGRKSMVWCGFISSFIGLNLVVLYPCDLLLMGLKVGWNGDEIDTTNRRKRQKILSASVPRVVHGDFHASYSSQPTPSHRRVYAFYVLD